MGVQGCHRCEGRLRRMFDGAEALTSTWRFGVGHRIHSTTIYNIQRNWLYMDNIPILFAPSWKFCGDKELSNSHGTPGAYVAREDCDRVLTAILLARGEPGPKVTQQEVFDWMC
ncbi:hypothetical protein PHYPSEUDO_004969 [Phytophthora pseudosyringae]|uniref:Uncharacterized protein n=1 Tax=Phytophthora pseudosyringae TaxID=221518 RepID=A0A8T1WGI3_9STRA|nr:hypothetical protein PHYPSEUDO_004969 [Phytophthora pseudosyringae]